MSRLPIFSLIAALLVGGLLIEPASADGATTGEFTIEQTTLIVENEGTWNPHGQGRGQVLTGSIASSDPRVAGMITTVINVSWTKPGGVWNWEARIWGTFHLENDAGSWDGTFRGSRGPDYETGLHIIDSVGHGSGAYEGLKITFHMEGVLLFAGSGQILDPGSQ